MLSRRNRFAYSKTLVMYLAPLALIFVAIWLSFIALLIHGVVASDPSHMIVGIFGSVGGFFLMRISVGNFRQALRDYKVSRAQRQK